MKFISLIWITFFYSCLAFSNEVIEIEDFGHEITVDEGNEDHQGGEVNMYAVDIDFYSTYYVTKDFGILK